MMDAVVKMFTTPKGHYLYDRNTNSLLQIKADEYEALQNEAHPRHDVAVGEFQSKGFLLKGRLKGIQHSQYDMLEQHLNNRVEQLTMQVTQNCNLRCEYCAYSGNYNTRTHSNKVMNVETMYKSVDFIMRHSKDVPQIAIGFYGGEPLLALDNIKRCVGWLC